MDDEQETKKIIITFNNKSLDDVMSTGTRISLSWSDIGKAIESKINIRPDEVIDGLLISNDDIQVKLSRIRIRRKKNGT